MFLIRRMITADMNEENVWIEREPHERKFKSNTLNTKCIEKEGTRKISKTYPERLENRSYGRGEDKYKRYSKFLESTRMWLQGFYTAVNFKLTLKESRKKNFS